MTELDLLNLGRSITSNELGLFTQVITINFAMVVGIYYFLHRARTAIRIFAFIAYAVGMLLFLGEMLIETNVKYVVMQSLAAVPHPNAVTQEYIGISKSWLATATGLLFNGAFWILGIGVFYLLFFWDRRGEES
jgi:hypothetical protein